MFKTKKALTLLVCALFLNTLIFIGVANAQSAEPAEVPQTLSAGNVVAPETPNVISFSDSTGTYPYEEYFVISAYYSPLPGQAKYVTSSYEGDIRLNGSGVNGADGTPVYPGMIAAPKNYPFGTKMKIQGVGVVAVHDRGGAIVNAGERGHTYDRLDIWMGYGDLGLKRALSWGKRTVLVTVYGVNPNIQEKVYLEGYSESEKYTVANTLTVSSGQTYVQPTYTATIKSTLSVGSKGSDVEYLQEKLSELGYFKGEVDGIYDQETADAVTAFQLDQNIISSTYDYGAGYFGPKTSRILSSASISVKTANAQTVSYNPDNVFNTDMQSGASGDEVRKLQTELSNINLFGVEPTGFYGELTEHAVFKFQQSQGLVGDKSSPGAGIFGPITRTAFNQLLSERERIRKMREEEA
jgi:peptidoglycan hydrolase-like protein with peptidoglycan-binding domain/3D (Asp-Asp-Asp) domain-containing protein